MNDSVAYYIKQLFEVATSPWAPVVLLIGCVLIYIILNVPNARWWLLSMLLYCTTFGVSGINGGDGVDAASQTDQATGVLKLAFPLNLLQTNARSATVLCLAFLLLPTLMSSRGRRQTLFTFGVLSFFCLEGWITVRLMISGEATVRSLLDAVIFPMMFVSLAVGAGRWLQGPREIRSLVKSMLGFGMLFVLGNVYQIILVPSTAMQGRLTGTTPNAQVVGQAAAFVFVPALFLAQDRFSSRAWRVCGIVIAGIGIAMVLWSGSRTGMLMLVAGAICLFGLRQYRIILPAAGLLLVLWIVSLIFPTAFAGIDRFLDTSNDRALAWQDMLESFYANPLLGKSSTGMGYGESTFLATLAFYGVIGGIPMIAAVIATAAALWKVLTARRVLGSQVSLVNFIVAQFALILISATFESGLLGSLNLTTMVIYLDFAMLACVLDEIVAHEAFPYDEYIDPELSQGNPYADYRVSDVLMQ